MEQSPTGTRPDKRFLLIGAGGWGRTWGRTLQAAEGVELAGVVDPSSTALERMCEEFAVPQAACFRSLAGALKATSCDAVIVATPMWSHHDAVSRCLEAGKHVLCEKPLATSMAEAASLDHAATRTGHIPWSDRATAIAARRALSVAS